MSETESRKQAATQGTVTQGTATAGATRAGTAEAGFRRRGLLVGIRTYPAVPPAFGQPLAGCHNDVAALRRVILARGFEDGDLEVLIDPVAGCGCPFCGEAPERASASPTRAGILAAMERLLEATEPGDVALLYFSGHGSEISGRGLYSGRRFQTFVPHDSGRGEAENRDVTDLEVQDWIRRMGSSTPYLTLIFDCCHSGGVADLRGASAAGRRIATDERRGEAAYAPDLRRLRSEAALTRGEGGSATRGALVLSACAARELASETEVETRTGTRRHGLFTHHLTRVLERPPSEGERWADVFGEIARGVTAENLAQHPRRGGNGPVFEPGPVDLEDTDPPDVVELSKLAVVIGTDYREEEGADREVGFPPLASPQRDAREVARVLAEEQGYEVVGINDRLAGPVLGAKATRRRILRVLHRLAAVKVRTRRETAVVIYFAGHGVTRTAEDGVLRGYLIPWGADRRDPSTWLAMEDLRDQLVDGIDDPARLEALEQRGPLARLGSRHLLLVLDCCFGGALAYDFFRGGEAVERPIYYSEYRRFVEGTAWQLLTSASFNQQALDRDPKDPEQPYSPFARALIEGLCLDAADAAGPSEHGGRGDHLITAAELHHYIDRRLREMGVDVQTPGLVDLRPRDGQFIFSVPGYAPTPLPDPPLDPAANPWAGPRPYGPQDAAGGLFHGRERALLELLASFLGGRLPRGSSESTGGDGAGASGSAALRPVHLAVIGPSGAGVTSLLKAGLLPLLADPVAARRRLRSWLRRRGEERYLVSRDDLRALRRWCDDLSLGEALRRAAEAKDPAETAEAAEDVARRVRAWAIETGQATGEESGDDGASGEGRNRILRQSLGVPSFDPSSRRAPESGWRLRQGLLALADRPLRLLENLRLWYSRHGLADFLSLPDRALPDLVGRYRVVEDRREAVEALSALGTAGTPEAEEAAARRSERVLWLCDPLEEHAQGLGAEEWEELLAHHRLRIVAGMRAYTADRDPEISALLSGRKAGEQPVPWNLHAVAPPGREELWEVVQGPAAARVLTFEPPQLARTLAEEAWASPVPLSLLSTTLAGMVERAWERRGSSDRRLSAVDLGEGIPAGVDGLPEAPLATLLARRAEALYRRLAAEGPALRRTARSLLLRGVTVEDGLFAFRRVPWRELELADRHELRSLEDRVLPALVGERVMVAGARYLEVAADGLLRSWPRLVRWLRLYRRRGRRPQEVSQASVAWEAAGFGSDRLWTRRREVPRLLARKDLNLLERAFLTASDATHRQRVADALAAAARSSLEADWTRSALLAAGLARHAGEAEKALARLAGEDPVDGGRGADDAAARALREARQRCRWLAEQTLRDVLAATPLPRPLPLPLSRSPEEQATDRLEGLCFGVGGRVFARFASARNSTKVWSWSPEEPTSSPRQEEEASSPAYGEGEVQPRRALLVGPVEPFPPVPPLHPPHPSWGPHAQSGHDRSLRYFAPGQLELPPPLRPAPARLLGHRGVATFLSFSRREVPTDTVRFRRPIPRWLASGANTASGIELRLWAIDEEGGLAGEPGALPAPAPEPTGNRQGDDPSTVARLDRLPVTLRVGDVSWQLVTVAEDGSSFELRAPDGGPGLQVEVPAEGPASPPAGLREVRLGPGGRWVAAVTRGGWAGVWSLPGRELAWRWAEGVATLSWSEVAWNEVARSEEEDIPPCRPLLAVGHLDGTVRLWPCRPEPGQALPAAGAPAVELRGGRAGFSVEALSFETCSRRLRVARRSVYEPFDRSLETYRLDPAELAEVARYHAGRSLEAEDLPAELRPDLAALRPEPPEDLPLDPESRSEHQPTPKEEP